MRLGAMMWHERLRSLTTLDTDADEVGVGTVTPDAKFHVESAQTHAGRFTSSVGTNDESCCPSASICTACV